MLFMYDLIDFLMVLLTYTFLQLALLCSYSIPALGCLVSYRSVQYCYNLFKFIFQPGNVYTCRKYWLRLFHSTSESNLLHDACFTLCSTDALHLGTFHPLQDDNVRFLNEYDEALPHLVFAGSDIILCQSFDDPVLQVPVCVNV